MDTVNPEKLYDELAPAGVGREVWLEESRPGA